MRNPTSSVSPFTSSRIEMTFIVTPKTPSHMSPPPPPQGPPSPPSSVTASPFLLTLTFSLITLTFNTITVKTVEIRFL